MTNRKVNFDNQINEYSFKINYTRNLYVLIGFANSNSSPSIGFLKQKDNFMIFLQNGEIYCDNKIFSTLTNFSKPKIDDIITLSLDTKNLIVFIKVNDKQTSGLKISLNKQAIEILCRFRFYECW